MRRNMSKVISVVLTMSLALSMCACSAKSSADTENTTAEAETEIEKEEETEEETVDASGNDPSGNDVSDNDVSENDAEESTEASPESEPNAASEEEEEIEEESTNSKTSEKDSTKSETTTSETTTEAVTVQGLSAVVNGTHYVGETLTGADFTVTVTMSDGSTLTNPAGWSAQPLTLNSTSNLITVAYEGASVTITVEAQQQVASNSGSGSSSTSSTTGSTSGTTAGSTSSSTTSATTSTTQSSTTSATTGTTAATTQAETTTAAPTTTAAETTTASEITMWEWKEGEWSYAYAQALFIAQNELREEAGLDPFIWSDELYEVAKQCSKICGDNGKMDHTLTYQYRIDPNYDETDDDPYSVLYYGENLLDTCTFRWDYPNVVPEFYNFAVSNMETIKNSPGHYAAVISEHVTYTGIAAYNYGEGTMVSFIFD